MGCNLLPPPRRLCFCQFLFVCLFVCVCVYKITQKVMDGSFWNFEGIGHGISYKWLNFGGNLAGILDSGSLWNFRYHCVKVGIREPLAKRQCRPIQSRFLGHVELGHCGKCNSSLKRVGEIYSTIWQALGGGVRATTAFLVFINTI